MSGWTKTPPNSVRTIEPVGQASRQPACSQCLQTSDEKSHDGRPAVSRSTNLTWRQLECPSSPVWSYDERARQTKPSCGTSLHSLQATSHALQPMHSVESVKKPVVGMLVPAARPRAAKQ